MIGGAVGFDSTTLLSEFLPRVQDRSGHGQGGGGQGRAGRTPKAHGGGSLEQARWGYTVEPVFLVVGAERYPSSNLKPFSDKKEKNDEKNLTGSLFDPRRGEGPPVRVRVT